MWLLFFAMCASVHLGTVHVCTCVHLHLASGGDLNMQTGFEPDQANEQQVGTSLHTHKTIPPRFTVCAFPLRVTASST